MRIISLTRESIEFTEPESIHSANASAMSEGYDQIFNVFTQILGSAASPPEQFSSSYSFNPSAMPHLKNLHPRWMRHVGFSSSLVGISLVSSALFQNASPRRAYIYLIAGIGFSAFGVSQIAIDALNSYFPPCESISASIIEHM